MNILKHILAVLEDNKDLFLFEGSIEFFVQLVVQQHVKNLILLLIADKKQWTFALILKWRKVGRQSNGMNAFFFMAFCVAL